MRSRYFALLLLAGPFLALGLTFTSCQTDPATGKKSTGYWWSQNRDKVNQTLQIAGQEAFAVGVNTLLNVAMNQSGDYNHSIAEGLRSSIGQINVAADVYDVVKIWGPPSQKTATVATQLADIYKQAAPQNQQQAAAVVEQIAQGIQSAAAEASP